jgi:hypothetical protein
MTIYKD